MLVEEVFEKAIAAIEFDRPFVLYRKPESTVLTAMVQKDNRLDVLNDFKDSGFVMSPFDQSRQTLVFREENSDYYRADLRINEGEEMISKYSNPQSDQYILGKEDHLNLVRKGLEAINNDQFEKVVLSRSEEVIFNRADKILLFSRLMNTYPQAFVYLWYHPQIGYWTGASPETLIQSRNNTFRTMSLAGTQKDQGQEVKWADKEIREQQIVTDHLLESLKGFTLELGPRYTRKAGSLLHICNDIHGHFTEESDLDKLIPLLHPTAAVCGFPKQSAKDFILAEENYDREYYTGFLGELNLAISGSDETSDIRPKRESNLFVNLRCMQLKGQAQEKALIYIGGGITAESDPDKEWTETVDKSLVMKSVLSGLS